MEHLQQATGVDREEQQARSMRNAAWLATVAGQEIVRRGRFCSGQHPIQELVNPAISVFI